MLAPRVVAKRFELRENFFDGHVADYTGNYWQANRDAL
jgi:hypothetical protein